jgi:hypothetical protein
MPNNYVLLERTELNATTASVTFANIPQSGYTDLKIVMSARTESANVYRNVYVSFNGSTSSFSSRELYGTGSATGSGNSSTSPGGGQGVGYVNGTSTTASTFSNNEIYIPNYRSSVAKSISNDFVVENNATSSLAGFVATLWNPGTQAAITSITLTPDGTNFVANSTFSLYGLAALGTTPAIAPKASGGNIIDYDGTYWIHTFLSSGTFTPAIGLTCDYLVVAGGGAGGAGGNAAGAWGGGGGAGGYRTASAQALTATGYSVTVGAGGAPVGSATGASGNDSVFNAITSSGGGGGGKNNTNGVAGGSGGGCGVATTAPRSGGAGNTPSTSPSQGNSGGSSSSSSQAGSGGGSSAAGTAGSSPTSGGAGTSNSITGSAVTYAAGGGFSNSTAGAANTGNGGGANTTSSAAAGGSGVVIIRYPAA